MYSYNYLNPWNFDHIRDKITPYKIIYFWSVKSDKDLNKIIIDLEKYW